MNETPIQIVGNLTRDVELRNTPNGTAVANLRIAANPRRFDRFSGSWVDGETTYFDVEVWGFAANVAQSFAKGDRVVILSTVRTRSWAPDDASSKRSALVVVAGEVGASTRYAIAKPQRAERGPSVRELPPAAI